MRHRLLALTVALCCLGAGCGRGSDGADDADDAGGRPTGRRPGELRVAVGEDIWPLTGRGPSSKHFAAGELNVGIYETLVRLGPDYTVRPALAERWELVEPSTWRFHLRRGVTFHDGRPFTADDVEWSLTGRELPPTSWSQTLGPGSVRKVDDLTVDITPVVPNHRLPEQLVHPEGAIVPRDGHNDSDPPVGTGPYRMVEYRPRRHVEVERFDGYWGDKARTPRLVFRFMPDAVSRVEALRDGEVDLVAGPPLEAVTSLDADRRLQVVRSAPGATQVLSFNPSQPGPDRAVREAVSVAVDRTAYVASVLQGHGDPSGSPVPRAVLGPAADLVEPPVHDPERARRVLEEAGWAPGPGGVRASSGRRLQLTLIGGPSVPESGLRLVQAQLGAVGVAVAVKKAHDVARMEEYRHKGFDLELGTRSQNDANPAFLLTLRLAPSPEYEAKVGGSLAARTPEEVQRLAAEMIDILVSRELIVVPLASVPRLYVMRRGVDLPDPHPSAVNQSWAGVTASG